MSYILWMLVDYRKEPACTVLSNQTTFLSGRLRTSTTSNYLQYRL